MELIHIPTPKYVTAYAESRIGGRKENQDSFGWQDTPLGFLVIVCDGMGGGPAGQLASTMAVKEIIAGVMEGNPDETHKNILIKAIRRANLAIIEAGEQNPALKGMGTTCTVLLVGKKCATIAYVGDSRIYQLRGKSKVFRTFDHSMVFDLVRQKVITEEQARLSAQSNVITRALGVKPDVEVDTEDLPYIIGDRFMLCTDGIHGSIPEDQLVQMASNKSQSLGAVTDGIATTVDGEGRNTGGGHDNLTIAIIETNINSTDKTKMNHRTKIILLILSVLLAVSLVLNFSQLVNHNHESDKQDNSSIVSDSLKLSDLNNEIENLKTVNKNQEETIKALVKKNQKDSLRIQSLEKFKKDANDEIARYKRTLGINQEAHK